MVSAVVKRQKLEDPMLSSVWGKNYLRYSRNDSADLKQRLTLPLPLLPASHLFRSGRTKIEEDEIQPKSQQPAARERGERGGGQLRRWRLRKCEGSLERYRQQGGDVCLLWAGLASVCRPPEGLIHFFAAIGSVDLLLGCPFKREDYSRPDASRRTTSGIAGYRAAAGTAQVGVGAPVPEHRSDSPPAGEAVEDELGWPEG